MSGPWAEKPRAFSIAGIIDSVIDEVTLGIEIALALLISIGAGILIALYLLGKNINKSVEKVLKDASTEEQDVIRQKIVKAVFPPRFPRD